MERYTDKNMDIYHPAAGAWLTCTRDKIILMYLGKYDIAWIFRFLRWITLNTIVIISDDDVRNAETYYELFC